MRHTLGWRNNSTPHRHKLFARADSAMSRIVLVARDPSLALSWRGELGAGGTHDVVAVTNSARSAQALLAQHRPQLVVCDLRLIDGTALAMIQWLALQAPRPLIVAVAHDDAEPLLLEALRAGADNLCAPGPQATPLAACVDQTLRGETALSSPLARALLEHFERGHAQQSRWHSVGDEQSPLQLEAPQRELLMRLASGYGLQELAQTQRVTPRLLGERLRTIVRKLQWDVRAGSLSLQLS
jgi:DNA-binding NarL/FixJ family response regulator